MTGETVLWSVLWGGSTVYNTHDLDGWVEASYNASIKYACGKDLGIECTLRLDVTVDSRYHRASGK